MRTALRGMAALCLLLAARAVRAEEPGLKIERAEGPLPALDWDRPVLCDGQHRFQCDEAAKVCRVAPARELDASGAPTLELSRAQPFCEQESLHVRALAGHRLVQAVAEAPPGWVRDERGRVMQFNFDMHRRLWLGGGFAPDGLQGPGWKRSGEAEFGTRIDFAGDDGDTIERLHLLEGRLDPGIGRFDVTSATLDWSHVYARSPIRLTTFAGKPRRFDLHLDVGLYLLAGRFEVFTEPAPQTWTTVGAVEPTLDLWRSKDLDSYLRLRAGPAMEHDSVSHRSLFAAEGGLDFEGVLDADGFHRLYLQADAARIWGLPGASGLGRVEGKAGYELIVLAVNDQPISAVLEGRGSWRDDLAFVPAGWDWGAYAGLRFSFWAPARRGAARVNEAR